MPLIPLSLSLLIGLCLLRFFVVLLLPKAFSSAFTSSNQSQFLSFEEESCMLSVEARHTCSSFRFVTSKLKCLSQKYTAQLHFYSFLSASLTSFQEFWHAFQFCVLINHHQALVNAYQLFHLNQHFYLCPDLLQI